MTLCIHTLNLLAASSSDRQSICVQDYSLVPGEHTAQAFQGLTFGGNGSGIGIGLGMLQQQQQAAQTQGFQQQVPPLSSRSLCSFSLLSALL